MEETIKYVLDVVLTVLGIIITAGLGYLISLIKQVIETNQNNTIKLNNVSQAIIQIEKDTAELKKSKEESINDINKLRILYIELKTHLDYVLEKLKN